MKMITIIRINLMFIIKEKIKETNIQKYGVEKASSNPIISNKISKSMIDYWKNNEDKKKIGRGIRDDRIRYRN